MAKYETRVAEGDPNIASVGVTKVTIDRLLKEENQSDLLALYLFLSYTARWQGTDQPKCTVSYIAAGLGWNERTVQRRKSQLRAMGLIEDVASKDAAGKVIGWYVRVGYLVKVKTTPAKNDGVDGENHGDKNAGGGEKSPKCLLTGNDKCFETSKDSAPEKITPKHTLEHAEPPLLPAALDTPAFRAAWEEYIQYRKDSKLKKLLPRSIQKMWSAMSAYGVSPSIAAIERSIANGWQGIFLTEEGKKNGGKRIAPGWDYYIHGPGIKCWRKNGVTMFEDGSEQDDGSQYV